MTKIEKIQHRLLEIAEQLAVETDPNLISELKKEKQNIENDFLKAKDFMSKAQNRMVSVKHGQ